MELKVALNNVTSKNHVEVPKYKYHKEKNMDDPYP